MDVKNSNFIGKVVNNLLIKKYINSGSFGDVFKATDINTNVEYAIKIPNSKNFIKSQESIVRECKIYKDIYKNTNSVPNGMLNVELVKYKNIKLMKMGLLKASLESIKKNGLRLKDVILIAIHMLYILKTIHETGYIHRDLKPENIGIGKDDDGKNIYCIDFGLAKKYLDKNGVHNEFRQKEGRFCGTARYASINAHKGCELSRRDDLESLGYILIYLYKGSLPWQNIRNDTDKNKKYKIISKLKSEKNIFHKCLENMPIEFKVFLDYSKNLKFEDEPKYEELINIFINLFKRRGYHSSRFSWVDKINNQVLNKK